MPHSPFPMPKVIIFDFDGTLADTFHALVKITNRLADEFGYKPATPEEIPHLQNLNSWQIIQLSGISIFKLPFLVRRVRAELRNDIQDVSLFSGIKETLIELKNLNHQLAIITSNSKENVQVLLQREGLEEIFEFIYSGSSLFGKHKVINKWLQQEHVNREQVIRES